MGRTRRSEKTSLAVRAAAARERSVPPTPAMSAPVPSTSPAVRHPLLSRLLDDATRRRAVASSRMWEEETP